MLFLFLLAKAPIGRSSQNSCMIARLDSVCSASRRSVFSLREMKHKHCVHVKRQSERRRAIKNFENSIYKMRKCRLDDGLELLNNFLFKLIHCLRLYFAICGDAGRYWDGRLTIVLPSPFLAQEIETLQCADVSALSAGIIRVSFNYLIVEWIVEMIWVRFAQPLSSIPLETFSIFLANHFPDVSFFSATHVLLPF